MCLTKEVGFGIVDDFCCVCLPSTYRSKAMKCIVFKYAGSVRDINT